MPAQRRTTTQKGLGYPHKQAVKELLRVHVEGTPCWWCAEPMYLAQGLHGDHSVPRSRGGIRADRLLHSWCNIERGDGSRDHLRPAITGKSLRRAPVDLGTRVLRWPA